MENLQDGNSKSYFKGAIWKTFQRPIEIQQANLVCERMHQIVGNILRILLRGNPIVSVTKANRLLYEYLPTAQHAMRTSIHTTLGSSPGA